MRIGALDRPIVIDRKTVMLDDRFNSEMPPVWSTHATLWAEVRETPGREALANNQLTFTRSAVFFTRYADVRVLDRIRYDGITWQVTAVRELGRRAGLEIAAFATDDDTT